MNTTHSFIIGEYTVIPEENSIRLADNEKMLVQAKIMEVLVYLANSYPRLVSRSELIDSIWSGNYPVGEKTLTNAIWRLRQILKQNTDSHIETVRKSGYRLLIQPEYINNTEHSPSLLISPEGSNFTQNKYKYWLFTTIVIITLMFGYLLTINTEKSEIIIENLTSDPGRELFPNVSPQGNLLAYVWRKMDSDTNIYLKDLSQPDLQPKQLTFNEDRKASPLWSKNSQSLYFSSRDRDNTYCHIVRLNIITTEKKILANCSISVRAYAEVALSHDGNTLAFTGKDKNTTHPGIYFLDLTLDNATPTRFSCNENCKYQDRNFAFSPDDKSLAVTRRMEKLVENIFVVNIADKTSRQLTFGPSDIKGLIWHEDGDNIIYSSANSGDRKGYIVNIHSGDITTLNIPGFSYPNFIPQTNDLVFHQWQVKSSISQLSLSDNSASSPFPILQSKFDYHSADFSSSSKKLVYISNESGNNEVWTSDSQGQKRKQLTYLKSQLSFPRWSHNGEEIVFLAAKQTSLGNDIYIINVATQRINKLSSNFTAHFRPNWSFDDKAIITNTLTDNVSTLSLIPIKSEPPKILLRRAVLQAVQDTEENIWFTTTSNDGLWLYQPKNKNDNLKQVLRKDTFNVNYNWTVTDKGIYYQYDEKTHHSIMFYDFNKKQTFSLLKLPLRTLDRYSSMTYVSEENKLIFTQTEFPQVDIKRLSNAIIL